MLLRRHLWLLAALPLLACAERQAAPVAAAPQSRQAVLDAALR